MAKSYYLPITDKEKAVWLKNFSIKFNGYATSLGFTAADATAVANDSAAFSYMLDVIEAFKSETQERVGFKDILRDGPLGAVIGAMPSVPVFPAAPAGVPAGVFPRVNAIVKRMKAHPAYTEAIGKDCGIIGAETVIVAAVLKPVLAVSKEGGNVIINYKKGAAAGIRLLSKRGNETEFTLLSVVNKTSFKDTRANLVAGQPETRHYCAWFIIDDEAVGQCSDDVTFVV